MNARDILTAAYQVLHLLSCPRGVPHPAGGGGTPSLNGGGTPIQPWIGGTPSLDRGTLVGVPPHPRLDGVHTPPSPSDLARVPIRPGQGTPPPRCGQTNKLKLLPPSHPSDAVGNNGISSSEKQNIKRKNCVLKSLPRLKSRLVRCV